MKLSEVKTHLETISQLTFKLPSGAFVPQNFHVTEIGLVTRHFIDCGGKERIDKVINFQLFDANDFDHRLAPEKLLKIISLSERKLGLGDLEVEVEYQSDTIGKYGLYFSGKDFILTPKQTACLASDKCGIPLSAEQKRPMVVISQGSCEPGTGCC